MLSRKIKMPSYLRELHGEECTILSLILTYSTGFLVGLSCYFLCPVVIQGFYRILLVVLAVDLGAGVVANMSQGTTDYYAARPGLRWIFIVMHMIHPVLLWILFPGEFGILILGGTTLVFTSIVNLVPRETEQRLVASVLLVLNLLFILLLKLDGIPIFLLSLFSFKLIVGFAVRWQTGR